MRISKYVKLENLFQLNKEKYWYLFNIYSKEIIKYKIRQIRDNPKVYVEPKKWILQKSLMKFHFYFFNYKL